MRESDVELAALGYFQSLGYGLRTGADIDDAGERADLTRVLLEGRLAAALHRLNPKLPHEEVEQVVRTLSRPPHPTLDFRTAGAAFAGRAKIPLARRFRAPARVTPRSKVWRPQRRGVTPKTPCIPEPYHAPSHRHTCHTAKTETWQKIEKV